MTDPLDPPRDEGAPSTEPAEEAEPTGVAGATGEPDGQTPEEDTAPERRGVLAVPRRTLVLGLAAVVVIAVVVTLAVTLSGEDDRPAPDGAMPTLGSQFAAPPPASSAPAEPGAPAALPAFSGRPLWTMPMPTGAGDDDLPDFAVTDRGYVLQAEEEIRGLDRTGKQIWRFTPDNDDFTVRVTGSHVFVGYANPDDDRWPQPQVIIALDAATGAERWHETEASLWSVHTGTIYMSVCYGGQNNHIGDCTLSARDPGSNTTRWAIPTYASSRVVNNSEGMQALPTPPYLLVGSYPTGADSFVLSSHAPATGATLGRGFQGPGGDVGSVSTASDRTVVTTDDHDDNPADGCGAMLIGFSASGADEKWRYTARTTKEYDGRRCARQPVSLNDGRMGVTTKDGAPSVLNVENGAIEWSAPAKGQAITASGTTLLTVETTEDGTEDGNAELVAYRVGNAKPVWRTPFSGEPDTSIVSITDTQVILTGYAGDAVGYDLKTGTGWSYGGSVAQQTDTWFAVCDATSCRAYPIG